MWFWMKLFLPAITCLNRGFSRDTYTCQVPQEAMIFPEIQLKWATPGTFRASFYFFCHDGSTLNNTVVFSEQCSYLDTEKKDNLWETCWIKWATQQKRHKWLGVTFLPLFFQALHSPLLVLSLNSVSQSNGPTSTLLCLWHSCDFTIHCIPYYSQCLANLGPRPHYWGKVHCSESFFLETATSLK